MTAVRLRRSLLVIACLGWGVMTGCATLDASLDDLIGAAPDMPKADAAPPAGVQSFVVELRTDENEVEKYKLPLPKEPIYVQQVLDKSKAVKRFGRVTIQIWRERPDGGGHHKIDIRYDRKKRAIPPGYDYAIHAGDRLVIMKDKSTIMDDMLQSVGGPVASVMR